MVIFVGDDWAESHHDMCVIDSDGAKLVSGRLAEGMAGMTRFHELVAEHAQDPSEVVVGIETDRGLWVQALIAAGYQVYAINPLAVSRYRDRHHISGAKSDPADAKLLADVVRTDRHNHRPVAGDSHDVEAIKVLARAHQNLVWERTRHVNRLRSTLREYYPAALVAFEELAHGDTLAVLGRAPTPDQGAVLTTAQVKTALKRGGRQRYLESRAVDIRDALASTSELAAPAPLVKAYAATTVATVAILTKLNHHIDELETELGDHFEQHPDAVIYQSMPGLGVVLGARVLGEFGDDPDRYASAKSRKNYAGTSPITITSGKKRAVLARHIRNPRLYDALDQWAFCSLIRSPGCNAFYQERRDAGDNHPKALRALANRLVGILHGCLTHHTPYDEDTAWAHRHTIAA